MTVDLSPRWILNYRISDIIILTQKSARKDLAHSFEPWSLGKWFEGSASAELIFVSAQR
jgi:hypothetical protein